MGSLLQDSLRLLVGGSPRLEKGYHRAQVVAVCAQKGGVGKTTTAVTLAAGFALRQQKVLLLDIDAQGHCASSLHAVARGVAGESLTSVLLGKRRDVNEIAMPTAIQGLWLTPPDKDLGATEGVMAQKIGKELLLRRALAVARTHFDVVLVDCPPNLGTLTVNAMAAADWLLIPCDMSVLALEGVDDIFDTIDTLTDALEVRAAVLGVVRTRYDARNQKVNEHVDAALHSRYGRYLFETRIPVNTTLSQAQMEGQPIWRFDPECRGAAAYGALLDEVVARLRLGRATPE
jgi:chromosome partitioning protein